MKLQYFFFLMLLICKFSGPSLCVYLFCSNIVIIYMIDCYSQSLTCRMYGMRRPLASDWLQ